MFSALCQSHARGHRMNGTWACLPVVHSPMGEEGKSGAAGAFRAAEGGQEGGKQPGRGS